MEIKDIIVQTIILYPRHKKILSVGRRMMEGQRPAEMTQSHQRIIPMVDAAVITGVTVLLNLLVYSLPRKIVIWKR